MRKHILALTFAALLAAPAFAQQTQPNAQAAAPAKAEPCTDKIYHDFDFWIGSWTVTDTKGVVQGEDTVTREEGGCLLVEHWKSAKGETGQSYNYFDDGEQRWRQLWVTKQNVIDYSGGLNGDGAMFLVGQIRYKTGLVHPFKGTWTLNADKTVTQHFQEWDPTTEKWTEWFTGIYKKK